MRQREGEGERERAVKRYQHVCSLPLKVNMFTSAAVNVDRAFLSCTNVKSYYWVREREDAATAVIKKDM